MGTLFRSEEMALCQLFMQPEAAYSSISILGEKGIVQFRDLNIDVTTFKRNFVCELRRCEELERKLRYIETEVRKDLVTVPQLGRIPEAPNPRQITDIEVERIWSEVMELSQNAINLKSDLGNLLELKKVLQWTQLVDCALTDSPRGPTFEEHRRQLRFVAGVIQRERVHAFERMLWRVSRGNVFLRQAEVEEPIEDPATGNPVFKTVFVAFFQGENLKPRVEKVCVGFRASIYPCPDSAAERHEVLDNVNCEIEDFKLILSQTQDHRYTVLAEVAKTLHSTGVMCWVPVASLDALRQALTDGGIASGSPIQSFVNVIETLDEPPTFNRTNKFTAGFQMMIDAYGIATYRETNPALFTIITFPFLFAVMYGDLGHGIILTIFALYMVLNEKRYMNKTGRDEIWNIFFGGRYVILLSGLFSMYTGFIYNDVFSLSMNIFGSSWRIPYDRNTIMSHEHFNLDPIDAYSGTPYIFGIDPIWQVAENKLEFLNSLKLKLSITIAVIHMTFGVSISIVNNVYFKNYVAVAVECLPKLLFILLFIGYTVVLIFIKWSMFYSTNDPSEIRWSPQCAPSLLVNLINIVFFETVKLQPGCEEYIFDAQPKLQLALLLLLILCIPVMVFAKPLQMKISKDLAALKGFGADKKKFKESIERDVELGKTATAVAIHHEEDLTEILIHQAIHTLEFVLSTVDNTASYLRLWVLSLAHAQLSDVLWVLMMRFAFLVGPPVGAILTFIAFGTWAFFTLAIIIVMEGISASLHTLQLHWVEFMSKFYNGSGYPFQPFSFKDICCNVDNEEY